MSQLRIKAEDGAVTFEVRVAPRASRSRVIGVQDGVLKVALTAAPIDGAANAALQKLIAKALGVSKSRVGIIRGERARNKVLRVAGIGPDDVAFDDG